MKRFTQLFFELDQTTRTLEKVAALERYFKSAPPEDAAWALFFLSGQKIPRAVSGPQMRLWAGEVAQLPAWIVEESYDSVGDLGETIALLVSSPREQPFELALHELVEERILPLKKLPEEARKELLFATWAELDSNECLIYNKLIGGEFRVGVSRTLVVRALAAVAKIDAAVMAHRVMGTWRPTADTFLSFLEGESTLDLSKPYPFYLAYPVEGSLEDLGNVSDWQAEWKWDGIRAQLIKRGGEVMLWSRGEELITDRFPEIAEAATTLPDGTVLDGEVLAWRDDKPLSFGELQKRIGRKKVDQKIIKEVPIAFMIYDLLELDGEDLRTVPLEERRQQAEILLARFSIDNYHLSSTVAAKDWEELRQLQRTARERLVEGLMLKRRSSSYGVGRTKGDWWKWKIEPYTIDAVLIYAQQGHGRRASLFTDYTFGVWSDGKLVPIAKAYSGLTDEEIRRVDAFIRQNTLDKFGPVRVVSPKLVFELAFEGIQQSTRHKSGVALRFPRMSRWRDDKPPEEADTLETVKALMKIEE